MRMKVDDFHSLTGNLNFTPAGRVRSARTAQCGKQRRSGNASKKATSRMSGMILRLDRGVGRHGFHRDETARRWTHAPPSTLKQIVCWQITSTPIANIGRYLPPRLFW
jgi:hypothetical protein